MPPWVVALLVAGAATAAVGAYAYATDPPGGRWFLALVGAALLQVVVLLVPGLPLVAVAFALALVAHYVAWTAVALHAAGAAERFWPAAGMAGAGPPAVVGGAVVAGTGPWDLAAAVLAGSALVGLLVAAVAVPLARAVRRGATPGFVAGGLVPVAVLPVVPDVLLALELFGLFSRLAWGLAALGVAAGLAFAAAGHRLPAGPRRWPGYLALASGLAAAAAGVLVGGWALTLDVSGLAVLGLALLLLFGVVAVGLGAPLAAFGAVAVRRQWARAPAVVAGVAVGVEASVAIWVAQIGGEQAGDPVPGWVLLALPLAGLAAGGLWAWRLAGSGDGEGDGGGGGRRRLEDL